VRRRLGRLWTYLRDEKTQRAIAIASIGFAASQLKWLVEDLYGKVGDLQHGGMVAKEDFVTIGELDRVLDHNGLERLPAPPPSDDPEPDPPAAAQANEELADEEAPGAV